MVVIVAFQLSSLWYYSLNTPRWFEAPRRVPSASFFRCSRMVSYLGYAVMTLLLASFSQCFYFIYSVWHSVSNTPQLAFHWRAQCGSFLFVSCNLLFRIHISMPSRGLPSAYFMRCFCVVSHFERPFVGFLQCVPLFAFIRMILFSEYLVHNSKSVVMWVPFVAFVGCST